MKNVKMKKILPVFIACLLALSAMTSCGNSNETPSENDPGTTAASDETVQNPNDEAETETAQEDTSRTVIQSDGSELTFDEIPENVLVLSSTTLELLDAVGVKIAASSSLSSKPDLAEKFKDSVDVGMATKPDMEIIAQVNPDVIIAGSMFINMKDQFDAQGYKTWFVNNQTYDDTLMLIERFGYLFDMQDSAAELINDFETRKQAVLDANKDKEPKTIMIIFGAGEQIMLGSDQCYSGSLAKLLGHNNVADGMDLTGASSGYIPFSLETAIASEPDIIFRVAHGNPDETKKMFDEMFDQNPAYLEMTAVKEGKVYDLSYDLFFSNPGLRCIEALEELSVLINK